MRPDIPLEFRVNGDEVALEEGPFKSAEDARYAIASGIVVPCGSIEMQALQVACRAQGMEVEMVTVRTYRLRETGEETDAELLVDEFEGVRETWMQRLPPKAVRPPAPMARKAAS